MTSKEMAPKIYKSTYPSFHIPTNISFPQFLLDYNPDDIKSDQVILEEFDDPTKVVTYGGVREIAAKGAAGLRNVLNIKEGDVVVILALNSLNWVFLAHSTMWSGGILWCVEDYLLA
jgi:4-coumarate--CoA ligase